MENSKKMSRRTFLGRSLTGLAALSMVPYVDLWAQERTTVAQWAPEASLYRFHLIGHGHIDPVWLWSWREGLSVVMSTFRAALDRMEENPEFKFTASSALFYRWVAENDPETFRKIRKRIDEGRWDVVGGWWIEPDVNLPGGEALVRQGLYGQRELEKLVGRRARTAFLPDSFGHNNCLPQILRQQGMTRYVLMRPMDHEKKLPADLFWWEGPDGSRLLAYRIQIGYSNSRDIRERLERIIREFGKQPTHTLMAFYGAGDHGGGPTKKNFKQVAEIRQQTGAPTLIYSTPDSYFEAVEQEDLKLSVVKENLHNHAVGCYSVESAIKKGNRQSETALSAAETITAIGSTAWGANYPKDEFTKAWQKVLFLQFHDSLAGSSQAEHSDVARHGYGYALETADQGSSLALQKLEWQIASEDPDSEYLIVFNPHAWEATCDLEYDLNIKGEARPLDDEGNPLPYQWGIGSSQCESVKKLLMRTTLPPMGYLQIRVIKQEKAPEIQTDLNVSERQLENRFLRISFSYDGEIGILDKETGREVFLDGETGCKALVLHDQGDTWGHGIRVYDEQIGAFGNAHFKVLENGPLRGVIRVTTTYETSTLTIDWMLYAEARDVEARVQVDWHEKQKILKFSFPVDLEADSSATVEAPFGYSKALQDGCEEPGHRWIDLSGTSNGQAYGLSVINDAKYGYSFHGNDMRITVLRSPVYAHHAPNKLDPDKEYIWMDQGIQTFRMKIAPHTGDWRQADIPRRADLFCLPPTATYQGIHGGHLPKHGSFLKMESPSVRITAIKQAESDTDLIVRCAESFGRESSATLHFLSLHTNWQGKFDPFEIKTLRIDPKNGHIRTVDLLEE